MWTLKSKLLTLFFSVVVALPLLAQAEELLLTLDQAWRLAETSNPEIGAFRARADAEDALISSASWLDSPRFGLMREQNMNYMQQDMGPMTSWTISQEIKFPLKYFASRSMQSARAEGAANQASDKALEVRQKVLTTYFSYYSAKRIASLLDAQKETLREIARAAEARRATGAVPQQDEMKAHVEQTRIENEILLQDQELAESEAMLRSLLNVGLEQDLKIPEKEMNSPKLSSSESIPKLVEKSLTGSKTIQAAQAMVNEANSQKSLAWLGLTPDFMVGYRRAFINSPPNAYAFSIEATIPLWFFMKETSEISSARARAVEAEKNLEKMTREAEADARSLGVKVGSFAKLLQIYETSLIPQALSTLNSSRAAYSAGKTSFVELLDSERSLYSIRIDYYRTLTRYVESLTRLERTLALSISDLPFNGTGEK